MTWQEIADKRIARGYVWYWYHEAMRLAGFALCRGNLRLMNDNLEVAAYYVTHGVWDA